MIRIRVAMLKNSLLSCRARPLVRHRSFSPPFVKRFASTFNWEDPLASSNLFTEEELAIQETAKAYCQERMLPRVLGEWKDLAIASSDVLTCDRGISK